jgi:4-hydroxy-tetrahydrodipicolinate synthase
VTELKKKLRHTGTALVTPFTSGGEVDETALDRLVESQIEAGVEMLLPCGTTGEAATLETGEWERVIARVVEKAAGRVPVIAGAGSNSTAHAIRDARRAQALGADGVLSVGPYYNKPNQSGFYAHFRAIVEAVDLPLVLYNVPGRTGSNVSAETTLALAELPGVVGIKEASGNLDQIMAILRLRPAGFRVLSGDDALTLTIMALGGDGVVAVTSNVAPKLFGDMVRLAAREQLREARALHYRLLPLMHALVADTNPIPVKTVLAMMGRIEEQYRLPLVGPSPALRQRLRSVVDELGLLEQKAGR